MNVKVRMYEAKTKEWKRIIYPSTLKIKADLHQNDSQKKSEYLKGRRDEYENERSGNLKKGILSSLFLACLHHSVQWGTYYAYRSSSTDTNFCCYIILRSDSFRSSNRKSRNREQRQLAAYHFHTWEELLDLITSIQKFSSDKEVSIVDTTFLYLMKE